MKIFMSIFVLGACLWLGSLYPWVEDRYKDKLAILASPPPMAELYQPKSDKIPDIPPPIIVKTYSELKFWVEKAGQGFSAIGTVGTIIQAIRRRKK
jgi:hypothetical protein